MLYFLVALYVPGGLFVSKFYKISHARFFGKELIIDAKVNLLLLPTDMEFVAVTKI